MQKIIPHLWFDKEAKEAAEFYASVFPESKVTYVSTIHDTPSGDCDIVAFDVWGYSFQAISAGPVFKTNPSISFMVNFDPSRDPNAKTHIDEIWNKLVPGGKVMMALDKYPFSERYGWIEDKFGVSWQLILTNPAGEERPNIVPSLMFTKDISGKCEEATDYYMSVFKDSKQGSKQESKRGTLARYPAGTPGIDPSMVGQIMFTDFMLAGQWFASMDGGPMHDFKFNEAISLLVMCEDQKEIDYYWEKLSAVPESEQCGWCKDKFGVSWQITPSVMNKMMTNGTPEQVARVTQAFMQMKKFDVAALTKAYEGK